MGKSAGSGVVELGRDGGEMCQPERSQNGLADGLALIFLINEISWAPGLKPGWNNTNVTSLAKGTYVTIEVRSIAGAGFADVTELNSCVIRMVTQGKNRRFKK
jgi:hypothetical protein